MRVVLVAALLIARVAAADTSFVGARSLDLRGAEAHDASFRRWVTQRIAERGGHLARWGWAQLDGDAAPERFAIVCHSPVSELLVEDQPGRRWSIARATRLCVDNDGAPWERDAPFAITLRDLNRGGEDTTSIALRGGLPAIVARSENVNMLAHSVGTCFLDEQDLERMERRFTRCRAAAGGGVAALPTTRAALFSVGGLAGRYRRRLGGAGDVPDFDVAIDAISSTVRVRISAARALRVGESFELWSTDGEGKPRVRTVGGVGRVLVLDLERTNASDDVALTIVAVSADGKTRVATSDLDPSDGSTLGLVVAPRLDSRRE